MTAQYLRKLSLFVGKDGQGLDLHQLHIKFTVHHRTTSTASTLEARIYNLSDATANTIFNEFTQIQLQAGYENSSGQIFGTIFTGSIVQVRRGRENPTDKYLDIVAAAGDIARNWSAIRKTLAKGHTPADVQQAMQGSMAQYGASAGYSSQVPDFKMPRGRVLYGNTRDSLDDFCKTHGLSWNINGTTGQLEFVPLTGFVPASVVELTSQTGMIGLPQQTPDGITARCLLRPSITNNRMVHINNASIQRASIGSQVGPDAYTRFQELPSVTEDGYYRVLAVDHIGDSRGQPWYTDMWCVSLTGQQPLTDTAKDMNMPAEWNPQVKSSAPLAVPEAVPESSPV